VLDRGTATVMSAKDRVRLLCSPSINLKEAGNLRFHFAAGGWCHLVAEIDIHEKKFRYT